MKNQIIKTLKVTLAIRMLPCAILGIVVALSNVGMYRGYLLDMPRSIRTFFMIALTLLILYIAYRGTRKKVAKADSEESVEQPRIRGFLWYPFGYMGTYLVFHICQIEYSIDVVSVVVIGALSVAYIIFTYYNEVKLSKNKD